MEQKKKGSPLSRLLEFSGSRRPLFYLGCLLVALSMLLSMVPYVVIWQMVNDLVRVAPNWANADGLMNLGWIAFATAFGGIAIYFAGLMCTHLVAFRIQTNITKNASDCLMHAPLGYFDNHASGMLRRRITTAAADVEQLVAHNMADIAGTVMMLVVTVVLLFVFDWRMGLACLLAAVISLAAMMSMMGGDNSETISSYQRALDRMSTATTEYVRGIPVVKVFQQTALSFRAFRDAVDDYSEKAQSYQQICEKPQSVNLTFLEGVFVLLIPAVLFMAPSAAEGNFVEFVVNFAFYAIFSAVISTALSRVMFASGGMMQAEGALGRVEEVLAAPQISVPDNPKSPNDYSIEFSGVTFSYEGSEVPALDDVSFHVPAGSLVALVGPSGSGKTTAASMIPRFWDADSGQIRIGGIAVSDMDPDELLRHVAFVFQGNRLFKASIMDNVKAARPDASREEVLAALSAAQCDDILAKFPHREDTFIGTGGAYLSGGEVQRVLIARAILKNAPIVVLDEATAFADPENEILIQRAFAQLAKDRTVVMVAHRLTTITSAHSIVVLDQGKVVQQGTHEELLSQGGVYERMWTDYQKSTVWKLSKEAM